jgi:hypothetical protein
MIAKSLVERGCLGGGYGYEWGSEGEVVEEFPGGKRKRDEAVEVRDWDEENWEWAAEETHEREEPR